MEPIRRAVPAPASSLRSRSTRICARRATSRPSILFPLIPAFHS